MDAAVLTLASAGLAMTTGGAVAATADVANRVRDYRAAVRAAPVVRIEDPRLRALSGQVSSNVAHDLQAESDARQLAEQRLAAASGATANLRRLWLSGAVALAGVVLSGTADIIAAVRG